MLASTIHMLIGFAALCTAFTSYFFGHAGDGSLSIVAIILFASSDILRALGK